MLRHSTWMATGNAMTPRRRSVRLRGVAAIALASAALLAFLSVAAGSLHQHDAGSGAAQIDCRACAWTHAAAAGLSHAPPAFFTLEADRTPPATGRLGTSIALLGDRTTRGPPALSL